MHHSDIGRQIARRCLILIQLGDSCLERKIGVLFFLLGALLNSTLTFAEVQPHQGLRATESVFRFHIPHEPHSLDPARLTTTDANYFFNNIMRGLYSYSNKKGLVTEGAKSCRFTQTLQLVCELNKTHLWSDGTRVRAEDYVRAFRHLLAPTSRNPGIELLKNIKNAIKFHSTKNGAAGSLPDLGVHASKEFELQIDFESPDPEFLYKLTSSILVPIRSENFPEPGEVTNLQFTGPYIVTKWIRGHRLRLERNPNFSHGNPQRPPIEILFVDEDQTALTLYEQGYLTFLRRLPTSLIPKYQDRKDFVQLPVSRFDYVGFGADLKGQLHLRAALALSADFRELQKIYYALGIPGCPSLPEDLMESTPCIQFDLDQARVHWQQVSNELKKKRWQMHFSKLGGDDLKKGAEWLQGQWKKNLGIDVDLQQVENGVYLHELAQSPPAIFRKGVGLERPTCLAALETFAKDGAENFLHLDDPQFELLLKKMALRALPATDGKKASVNKEMKSLCSQGIQHLIDNYYLIPLGRIHFTLLVQPRYKNWTLNEMNQLDLSQLSVD